MKCFTPSRVLNQIKKYRKEYTSVQSLRFLKGWLEGLLK